jgi:uncharacterized protein
MSKQENVEIARRGYRAFTSADPAQILAFLDPEIEIHDFPDVPDTAVYRGPSGFLALVEYVLGEFDDLRVEPEEFIAPDADHVVVMARTVGRGKGSGAEVEARVAHLWTIRDGKAIELRLYGDRADALEAVGPKA